MRSIEKLLKLAKDIEDRNLPEEVTAPAKAQKKPSLPPPPMAPEALETVEDVPPPPSVPNRPRVMSVRTAPVMTKEQLVAELESAYELLDQDLDRQALDAMKYRAEVDDPSYPASSKAVAWNNIRRQNLLTLFCTRYLNPWFEQVIDEMRNDLERPVEDRYFFDRLESRFNNLLKKIEEIRHYAQFGRFYTSDRSSVELGGPTKLDIAELYSFGKLKSIIHNQKAGLNKTPIDTESLIRHQVGLPVQ